MNDKKMPNRPHGNAGSGQPPNQGEGDRAAAKRYDRGVREFVAEGRVPKAAADARTFVEHDPEAAAKAEHAAKRGPASRDRAASVVARGRAVIDRVRPMVERVLDKVRARFARK